MKKNSYENRIRKDWIKNMKSNHIGYSPNWMEKGYDHDPMIWFWLFVFLIFIYGMGSLILDLMRIF